MPRPFDTWRWPKRQLSFGAQPSFLPTGLLYLRFETVLIGPASQFFVFLLSFAFFFSFGTRAIRYYISTRTTAAVPTSNNLESEESILTHHLLYVACTPRVACTVRLVLMCTCILRARTFKSNLFLLFVFFSLMRSPLVVLVSNVDFLFTTGFCFEYCCTIHRSI